MRPLHILFVAASLAACSSGAQPPARPAPAPAPERPRLLVFFTIDQLHPDYLDRFAGQFTGGLARLTKGGAWFTNAFQDHAITETAPGHASTMSGRFPRSTGIVGNLAGVLDPEFPLVGGTRGDPASPFRFRGTVLGDWLRYHNPRSRLVSVSRKDRGAILPLGRARGEAYWYASNGTFTTSRYYGDTLPSWVQRFNARRLPQQYAKRTWTLLLDAASYPEPDTVDVESGGQDNIFPHPFPADTATTTAVLANYPMMDEVTLQLALEALNARELGAARGRTDILAVSLSTTDAVGHKYGPDSREIHDQLLRLDRSLGAFLDSLYKVRDSSQVVLALTADHAVAPYPTGLARSRYRDVQGGYADLRQAVGTLAASLAAAGVDSTGYRWEWETLYLEPEAFARAHVNRDSVARDFAARAAKVEGVLRAEAWVDLVKKDVRNDDIGRRWQHMFPPDVPVGVVITLKPFWYWAGVTFATHGSPHAYDAHVPVLFAGAGVRPGKHAEMARVVDMAPTLAELLGVQPMEALDGVVLRRAIR